MFSIGSRGTAKQHALQNAIDKSILRAIDTGQAVIRFDMDGIIQDANANFLEATGYTREEILGKHHRMFCTPKYAASPEYKQFWQELGRGDIKSGRFKRKNKAGETIWLEAFYNPITDETGAHIGVVKFAIDISQNRNTAIDALGKIDAINRSLACIEFQTDGTILAANDNFLDAVGYPLSQIQGKHHSMFCEAEYATSKDYKQFWEDLAAGRFQTGQFQRFGQGGREIWIQATYNPILNAAGGVTKIVKFAIDVTEQRRAMDALQNALLQLSQGDLGFRLEQPTEGDFVEVFQAFNTTTARLAEMVGQIQASANQLLSGATSISKGATALSQRGEQQAASLEETSAAMEQMSERIKSSAQNASKVREAASEAATGVAQGEDIVRSAIAAMDRIEASSKQVTDIIKVIDSIAFQTNILSLNAAVEAARAGDAGKGFAVVAQEVRMLAQRSADAAKDITALIQASTKEVETGSRFVRQSGDVLSEINATTDTVVQNISAISESADEQSVGVTEIHRAVAELDQNTQNNAHLAVESADQAAAMADLARNLSQLVAFFSNKQEPASQPMSGAA